MTQFFVFLYPKLLTKVNQNMANPRPARTTPFLRYLRDEVKAGDLTKADKIEASGISDLASFADFEEQDVVTLCSTLRRPGGTITVDDEQLPNRGVAISTMCEIRLKLCSYAANYYNIVQRPIDFNSMAWNRVKHFKDLKTIVKNHTNPEDLPEISRKITIMKAIELIEEHLRGVLGVTKVPLAYVIRKEPETPVTVASNPLRVDLPYGTAFNSFYDEMIACTDHSGASYSEDNASVLNILVHVLKGTSFEVSIQPFKRNRDGRGAFLALSEHNLGSNRWETVLERADHIVSNTIWNGKSNRYPLKLHLAKHREAHNDMIRASQHIDYEVPNEGTRVRKLLHSLQCSDPRIISAKTSILADEAGKKGNFEATSNFLLIAAPPTRQDNDSRRISSARQNDFQHTPNKGSTGVELRFHTVPEYHKLTSDQKNELYNWRQEQKKRKSPSSRPGAANPPGQGKSKAALKRRKISAMFTEMADLKRVVAELTTSNGDVHHEEKKEEPSSKNRVLFKPSGLSK